VGCHRLVLLLLRLLTPQVGVGNVTRVCQSTCDKVYEACSEVGAIRVAVSTHLLIALWQRHRARTG
jgi:hypothetical protein